MSPHGRTEVSAASGQPNGALGAAITEEAVPLAVVLPAFVEPAAPSGEPDPSRLDAAPVESGPSTPFDAATLPPGPSSSLLPPDISTATMMPMTTTPPIAPPMISGVEFDFFGDFFLLFDPDEFFAGERRRGCGSSYSESSYSS